MYETKRSCTNIKLDIFLQRNASFETALLKKHTSLGNADIVNFSI